MNTIILHDEEQTINFGKYIGRVLFPECVICLKGDLGTGKTTLTRGIARGLNIIEPVTSPTFTIINQYEGIYPLYHIDTYRIDTVQDMLDIGIEEYLPSKDGITIIEWPELIEELLPDSRIDISLDSKDDNVRELTFEVVGNDYRYVKIIQELKGYENIRD